MDRTGERVIKGAFRDTIRRWQAAGRDVPLVWDHGRDAREVIGSVDSSSMAEHDAGLYIEASLDIEDSELAREAWRSVKRGRISLSFGYLTEAELEGADGVKELTRHRRVGAVKGCDEGPKVSQNKWGAAPVEARGASQVPMARDRSYKEKVPTKDKRSGPHRGTRTAPTWISAPPALPKAMKRDLTGMGRVREHFRWIRQPPLDSPHTKGMPEVARR